MQIQTWCGVALIVGLSWLECRAQEQFELLAPQLGVSSRATISGGELQVISGDGQVTRYARDARYDSADGQWLGYYSREARQILRWPAQQQGPMQLGEVVGNEVRYRLSQMQVQPRAGANNRFDPRVVERPVLPPTQVDQRPWTADPSLGDWQISDLFGELSGSGERGELLEPRQLKLATFDQQANPWALSFGTGAGTPSSAVPGAELLLTNQVSAADSWWVTPTGVGLVRLQSYRQGRIYAVSARSGGQVNLMPLAQDPRQLWRVVGAWRGDQRYVLESLQYPGYCLTHQGAGQLVMQAIHFAPTQLWVPLVAPPLPSFQPFYRTLTREVHVNPPLPPAQVELFNSHRNALVVLLGDSRQPESVQQVRIDPQSAVTLTVERDAGATIVETVETLGPLGAWERQQFTTAIPPLAFYDLSVYEEHLQSIAIDRTGKSPNPIEDVNYVPKSLGWIQLPAGGSLPTHSRIDVYQRAVAANNPGAVRRLDPKQFDQAPPNDRLENLLQELQAPPSRRQF